jgi:hypothetical protein
MTSKPNGSANARENPSMAMMGVVSPPLALSTNTVPTIGPVQEKETSAMVSAMKTGPAIPPLSALLSMAFTHEAGSTSSNAPKKLAANTIKIRKKNTLGILKAVS